jgi:glycosyltransferase involved in cell wall biosynthesis
VVNINDPSKFNFLPGAAFPESSPLKKRAYLFWLRRILRNADLITYPCRRLRDYHTRLAGLDHAAEIIPHIGSRPEHARQSPDGLFRLVHAGKLGTRELPMRPSKALLLGLKAFIDTSPEAAASTRLVLVGPGDKETQSLIDELGLKGNVQTVGRVNYEESLDYIASASACILIEACVDEGIYLPSKLCDYIVCGKPVLALSPGVGTAADLASRGELIRVDHDPETVRKAIAGLYSEFRQGTLGARKPSDRLIAQLQAGSVAERFLSSCQAFIPRPRKECLAARLSSATKAGSPVEQPF